MFKNITALAGDVGTRQIYVETGEKSVTGEKSDTYSICIKTTAVTLDFEKKMKKIKTTAVTLDFEKITRVCDWFFAYFCLFLSYKLS